MVAFQKLDVLAFQCGELGADDAVIRVIAGFFGFEEEEAIF